MDTENPTDERASHMILYFNFSAMEKDIDKVQASFNRYCSAVIDQFMEDYAALIPPSLIPLIAQTTFAHQKLEMLAARLHGAKHKNYVMINEYDNFTNTVVSEHGEVRYRQLIHSSGFFRDFFSVLKAAATGSGSALGRIFITGVSPVTMDDVTSGFNIGDNISHYPTMNACFGFTEAEVERMLDYCIDDNYLSISEEERAKGYADIVLKPFAAKYMDMHYACLLELKYIPRTDDPAKLSALIAAKTAEPHAQLAKYADDDSARRMFSNPPHGIITLKKGVVVFHGWEMVVLEDHPA